MLAVAEDSTAAQLMGIRPDTMQAIAWAIAAGATGLAGALIATFFYIVPTVGETLAIVAFVTVSLGGFGSVPGALVAGLLIGVIESLSGYLIGAVYKDIVVYALFVSLPLVPAAGPDGQDMMRRLLWPSVALALVIAYPLVRRRRSSSGSARWCCSMRSRRRPGTSSAAMPARSRSVMSCSSAAAPMPRWARTRISGCRRWSAFPSASSVAVAIAAIIGTPTLAAVRPLFQHGDDRGRRAGAAGRHQHRIARRGRRPLRPDRAAQRLRSLLHLGAALLLSLPRRPRDHAWPSPGG